MHYFPYVLDALKHVTTRLLLADDDYDDDAGNRAITTGAGADVDGP